MNDAAGEFFEYDGVVARLDLTREEIRRAIVEADHHLEEAEYKQETRDGQPFCGCSDCISRFTSGYWVAKTITWIRQGKIQI